MKKPLLRFCRVILISLGLLWLIFVSLLILIEKESSNQLLIRVFSMHVRGVDLTYITQLILSGVAIYGLLIAWKKIKRIIGKVLLVLAWILLSLAFLSGSLIWVGNHGILSYFEFSSPGGEYALVAEERSFLLFAEVKLFKRVNPFFIKNLETTMGIDDGYPSISQDAYWVEWDKTEVTLAIDANENKRWIMAKIDLAKPDQKPSYKSFYPKGKPAELSTEERLSPEKKTPQDRLDQERLDEIISIPDSNFGLIEIDRAMARRLWYFVEIKDKHMLFISEAPDTAPSVEGHVDSEGVIHLKFESLEGQVNSFESSDRGKTWTKD